MEIGYPDPSAQPLWGRKNVANALLVAAVPIPAFICAWLLFGWFSPGEIPQAAPWQEAACRNEWAALLLRRPVLAANLFYFVFVDLAFFAVALVQRSSWLIDPYWTLLPLLLAAFFLAQPLADPNWGRAWLSVSVLLVWSARLTGNYFRREQLRFGLREDWRYAKMRRERRFFWLEQFVVVQLTQHAMLVGLSLPFWAIAFRPEALGVADAFCFFGAALGIAVAGVADNQLDRFMRDNRAREARGEQRVLLLDTGLWRYSRHPNYFGEQLFWWSIAGFGMVCDEPWVAIGAAFNSCILATVTFMTERRMCAEPGRSRLYADYQRRTSVWIPWPPRAVDPS